MIFLKPASKEIARRELDLITVQQMRKVRILRSTLLFLRVNQNLFSTLIIKSLPRSPNILSNMLTLKSEASSRLLGSVTIVEGMVIKDPIAINYMAILECFLNHRYLKSRLTRRKNGR